MSVYLSGNKLYGDDFSLQEIEKWFENEKEGYANTITGIDYKYGYHALNCKYGFRFLPDKSFVNVLGFGSAYGDELKPIIEKIQKITIIEPSEKLKSSELNNVPISYVKPQYDGLIPYPQYTFDLITCFGVLHHIPNVSKVISEFYRCLALNGYLLIREPIVSMGDWRYPRSRLTSTERGIPLGIFRNIISSVGFCIIKETKCCFPLTIRLGNLIGKPGYNSKTALLLDALFCDIFGWNEKYHRTSFLSKLGPTSVFYVLKK